MDELRALVAATAAATAKEVAATIAATTKEIDAYAKANRELFAANVMATSHPIATNTMATFHPIAANATAFSHPTVAVSKKNNIPPSHGTCDGHDHATGGIVPAVTSPDPSGVANMAVLSPSPPSLNDRTARSNLLRAGSQNAMDADFAILAPVHEKLASEEATMANVPERLRRVGTTLASDRAMGGIAPTVTSSPGPSGITSMAVLSSPACVVKSSPPSTVTTSFPTLVTMGGIAPADACPEREANILEALRARPGIAPSVQIPSSTTTLMSLPTAAGLSDNVATATLRIEEVCARQDAHLEAFMADFRSIADDLDQHQLSTSAPFASIDDDDDDDKDEDIHIVLSIDDAGIKFEDIVVILAPPPPPLPYRCGCTLPGGGITAVNSQPAVGF
jgi:hypothetical protein